MIKSFFYSKFPNGVNFCFQKKGKDSGAPLHPALQLLFTGFSQVYSQLKFNNYPKWIIYGLPKFHIQMYSLIPTIWKKDSQSATILMIYNDIYFVSIGEI